MSGLKIAKTTISIGLPSPVRLLHITDSHITRGDSTGLQAPWFNRDYDGCAEDYFLASLAYAKKNGLTVLFTGDIIDFQSEENFAYIAEHLQGVDYMYAAGNHDFYNHIERPVEDDENKRKKTPLLAPYIKSNLYFDSRILGGVNFVTLDNSYYTVKEDQLERLKREVAKGYPVVVAMHVPVCTERLAESGLKGEPPSLYLMGAPEKYLSRLTPFRRQQQAPDEVTLRFIDYIENESAIKALITGHRHENDEDVLEGGLMQYVTGGSFDGYVREITIA